MNPHATPPTPEGEEPDPLLAALRQRLHQYGQEPPPTAWAAIRQRLPVPPRPQPWWRRPRYGRSALVLLAGALLLGCWLVVRHATPPGGSRAVPSATSGQSANHLARLAARTGHQASRPKPLATGVAAGSGRASAASDYAANRPGGSASTAAPGLRGKVPLVHQAGAPAERFGLPATTATAAHASATGAEAATRLLPRDKQAKTRHRLPSPLAISSLPASGAVGKRADKVGRLADQPATKAAGGSPAARRTAAQPGGASAARAATGQPAAALATTTSARRATRAAALATSRPARQRSRRGLGAGVAGRMPETQPLALPKSGRYGASPRVSQAAEEVAADAHAAAVDASRHGFAARSKIQVTGRGRAAATLRHNGRSGVSQRDSAFAEAATRPAARQATAASRATAADYATGAGRAAVTLLALRQADLAWPLPTLAPADPKTRDSLRQLPPSRRWSVLVLAGPTLSYRRLGGPDTSRRYPNFARLERPAPGLGAQVQLRRVLAGRWALAAGLGYQEYATRLALAVQDSVNQTTFTVHRRDTYRLLTVPVQLGYRTSPVGGRWALAALAGADAGWLWQARTTEGSPCSCQQQTYSGASVAPYARFSLALSLGLEARYRLGGPAGRWQWVLQPTGRYVVSRFVPTNTLGFASRQPFSLGLLTGLAWDVR